MQQPLRAASLKSDRVEVPYRSAAASSAHGSDPALDTDAVRDVMWRLAGLFRTRAGLEEAVERLDRAYDVELARVRANAADRDRWRLLNLVTVAKLIARAALRREESRGGHFREDFPSRDDEQWRVHMVDRRVPDSSDAE
jgi:succinate dehydrogenase/fumarate reductase flavoprotein subunit